MMMSTDFCDKFPSQLIDVKQVKLEKGSAKLLYKPLTGLRVSKAGRSDLYSCGSHEDVIKHIVCRLDAPKAKYRNFCGFAGFPDQSEGYGLNGGPAQTARAVP